MKSIFIIPIYIFCVASIILFGSRYVINKPNEIASFCHHLQPISDILDRESSLRINNHIDERWTYKMTFCLDQVKIVQDHEQYLLILGTQATASKILNYEHLVTLSLDDNFTHLYKAIE